MNDISKKWRAFTLIELLVVVAVIGILITLLMPVVRRSLDRARLAGCVSNIRQITAATLMYAGDHKGGLPHPCWGQWAKLKKLENGWLYSGDFTSRGAYFDNQTNVMSGVLWPYIEDPNVYRCPSDPTPDTATLVGYPDNVQLLSTYGMNGSLTRYKVVQRAKNVCRISQFQPTDIIIWEQEYRTWVPGDFWDAANSPNQGLSDRHYDKGGVGCIDGHVYIITREEYNKLARQPSRRRNRLWNNPYTANGH